MAVKNRLEELPLRAKKAGKTRLALLDALVEALREKPFEHIRVKDLCKQVGVSEPTFFNYYGGKHDVLVFYVRLWSIEVQCKLAKMNGSAEAQMRRLFEMTAEHFLHSPRVMYEIIAYQMRQGNPPRSKPPTEAELYMRFPDEAEIDSFAPVPVHLMLAHLLKQAIQKGELPKDLQETKAVRAFVSLFFGAPASTPQVEELPEVYDQTITLLWQGLQDAS